MESSEISQFLSNCGKSGEVWGIFPGAHVGKIIEKPYQSMDWFSFSLEYFTSIYHKISAKLALTLPVIPPEVWCLDGMFLGYKWHILSFGVWKPRVGKIFHAYQGFTFRRFPSPEFVFRFDLETFSGGTGFCRRIVGRIDEGEAIWKILGNL